MPTNPIIKEKTYKNKYIEKAYKILFKIFLLNLVFLVISIFVVYTTSENMFLVITSAEIFGIIIGLVFLLILIEGIVKLKRVR
jgi:hypothetical protein